MTTETYDDVDGGEDNGAAAFFNTSARSEDGALTAPDGTTDARLAAPAEEDAIALANDPEGSVAEPKTPTPADDDAELEWGEGTAKSKASLKALKEAYGKQSEVATRAAEVEAVRATSLERTARAETALKAMVDKATAKWAPYAQLDFLALSRDPTIDQETFDQLRKDASEAMADYNYLTQELSRTTASRQEEANAGIRARAQATLVALKDPVNGIPDFTPDLYTKMVDHAVAAYGAPKDMLLTQVDPWAVKLLHDAMQFRTGRAKAVEQVVKVQNRPTKVLSPGASATSASEASDRKSVIDRLRSSSGTPDDAADAFFATSRRAA